LKDSQNLIQKCENLQFEKPPILYSLDFSSLYSNINPKLAIPTLAEYLTPRIKARNFTIKALVTLLKIIFDFNIFKFEKRFFVQNKGLAMGCICGPSFANLYLHILEKSWLNLNKPLLYVRFIDDIWMALKTKLDLEKFNTHFQNLKLTMSTGSKVVFLDLITSFNILENKIKFEIYVKPTNNGNYLLPSTVHPKHITDNIPRNLMTRNLRACSVYKDFCFHTLVLCINLLKRGYDKDRLLLIFSEVSVLNRNSLIPYNVKNNKKAFFTPNSLTLPRIYTENLADLDKIFFDTFNKTINVERRFKLNLINKMDYNLGSILINGFSRIKEKLNITKPCNDCSVCVNLLGSSSLFIPDFKFKLSMLDPGDCNSDNIIYIIFCNLCDKFYIGETQFSLKIRMKQHLNTIKKFEPFIKYHDKVVAKHFNLKGHDLTNFKCSIFKKDISDSSLRKAKEQDLIRFFNLFSKSCLNLDITKKNKSLVFL